MIEMSILEAKTARNLARFREHCIYVVWDGLDPVYVGMSERNALVRLRQHFGSDFSFPSYLGLEILGGGGWAESWLVQLYTLGECTKVVRWFEADGSGRPPAINISVAFAEEAIIAWYRPRYNFALNSRDHWREDNYLSDVQGETKMLLGDLPGMETEE